MKNCDNNKSCRNKDRIPFPKALITGVYFGCLAPIDWNEDWNP
jgi:hypothetical protein